MADTSGQSLRGSCLCGDVCYRTTGPVDQTSACHCSLCRKWSGHYWASFNVDQEHLVLEKGEASLAWYPMDGTERGFCIICGTSLFWRRENDARGHVSVSLGTVEGDTGLVLDEHIYLADRGDYYTVPNDAPHFEADSSPQKQ
ncbi:MAG: GFA family protein [Pseudomonadota bacterium]